MWLFPRTLLHPVMLVSVKLLRCLRRKKLIFLNAIPKNGVAIFAVNHT